MTWVLIAVKFVKRYYKQIGVAVILGTVLAGVGTLYGAWQIERGLRIGLAAKLEAAKVEAETTETQFNAAMAECVEANERWQETLEEWQRQAREFQIRAESYGARIKDLEFEHSGIEMERDELQLRIEAISATDCTGAVDELIAALGWGLQ